MLVKIKIRISENSRMIVLATMKPELENCGTIAHVLLFH